MNDQETKQQQAFEYVIGTLRGSEREAFAKSLREDNELAAEVSFWESNLAPETESLPQLAPKPQTFDQVKNTINSRHRSATKNTEASFWNKLLPWKIATATAFSMLLAVTIFLATPLMDSGGSSPNADYVAVLVNEQDSPILTALAASEGNKLWLKWENWQPSADYSLQLWAQSKRDKQIRPLLVFDNKQVQELALDQATLRLIKDSSHLIMTKEEIGGSAIDEPSDIIIAKGVCIRLAAASS